MLEGLDESLVGMSAGDEKTFSSTLTGAEFQGEFVDVTVKVTAVKEQELPELDDDFAQQASEFDTLEELKADARERLTRGARLEQAAAARDAVLEKLLTMVDIPLPDGLIADELRARHDSIKQQLAYSGMTEEEYLESEGQTSEDFMADLEKRVRDAKAAQFLLDEIATAEALGVDENELTQHLLRRAQQAGQKPDAFLQQAMEQNYIPEFIAEVRRGKALAHVVESATVKDASGNTVELKNLQPDGTYADPEEVQARAEAQGAAEARAHAAAQAVTPPTDAAVDVITTSDYLTVDETVETGRAGEAVETGEPGDSEK